MSSFIEWLEGISKKDPKLRAVLRRSLAFKPGEYALAYPYVEPFIRDQDSLWRRKVHYLVAGLWSAHWREGRTEAPMSLGKACAVLDNRKRKEISQNDRQKISSIETRFITLLDADRDQLPNRLRQIFSLLKDQTIDFDDLLKRLMYWNDYQKVAQNRWARDFYRGMNHKTKDEPRISEEIK